jgi:hypothetical protein
MRARIFNLAALAASTAALVLTAATAAPAAAQGAPTAAQAYKPTIDDWVGVNAAINAYQLGLERKMPSYTDRAFWDDAVEIIEPTPGQIMRVPAKRAIGDGPPPGAPPVLGVGGKPMVFGESNALGNKLEPWHLLISSSFEFQSPTRATHYGYFLSIYPDQTTRQSITGMPGHYEDILEKRGDEWRILERRSVIGQK